jgi:hypothetical protein
MNNIANLQKLYYCDKKLGDRSKCSNIATRQVVLKNKSEKDNIIATQEWQHRCEEHSKTSTVTKCVVKSMPLDQSYSLCSINNFLKTLIGKSVLSKWHHLDPLKVEYVKPNTGGVMCKNEKNGKWKFVYYHQIDEII